MQGCPCTSSSRPERQVRKRTLNGEPFVPFLFGLAPDGVCRLPCCHGQRCALTAPFHPYQPKLAVCFLLHFPSRLATCLDVIQHRVFVGARTFLDPCGPRPSDPLAGLSVKRFQAAVKERLSPSAPPRDCACPAQWISLARVSTSALPTLSGSRKISGTKWRWNAAITTLRS